MEKYITIAVDVLSSIFCILFLIFGCLSYSNTQYNNNLVAPYKTNWNLSPINSVFITSKQECPSGYSSLFSTSFPGNIEGCDCTKSKKKSYKRKVLKNICEEDHIINGCTIIPERNSTQISQWKGKTICASRMKNFNYGNVISDTYVKICPRGKKQCGLIDTENNPLCIDENESCPINYIDILPDGESPLYTNNVYKLQLENGYILYMSNEVTSNPVIIDVSISENNEVCAHPYEGLLGENKYLLNKVKGPQQCQSKVNSYKNDWRYSEIDTMERSSFYQDNQIDTIVETLPQYPPIDNSLLSLNTINYFGVKPQCFNGNVKKDKLIEPDITGLDDKTYGLVVLCILQVIYIFGVVVAFKVMMKYSLSNMLIIIIDIIQFIFLLLIFGLALGISLKVDKIKKPYSQFISNQCGDELTTGVLKMAYHPLVLTNKYLVTVYGLSIFEIGLKIVYYIWYYLIRKN